MTRRACLLVCGTGLSTFVILAACTGDDPVPVVTTTVDSGPTSLADTGGATSTADGGSSSSSGTVPSDTGAPDTHVPTLCELEPNGAFERIATHKLYGTHIAAAAMKDGWVLAGHIQSSIGGGPITYTDAGLLIDGGDPTQFATVERFNAAGEVVWQRAFGGNAGEQVSAVTVDGSGDIYIAGYSDSASFKLGDASLSATGGTIGFVAKLRGDTGEPIWAQSLLSGDFEYGCRSLDFADGHLVAGCSMGKSQTYRNVDGLTATLTNGEDRGASIYSLDPTTGNAIWATALSSGTDTTVTRIESVDATKDFVVVAGTFDGPSLAGKGNIQIARVGSNANGFVLELEHPTGALHFGKGFGGSGAGALVGSAFAAGSSSEDGVYVSASYTDQISLGGSFTPKSNGGADTFVAVLRNKAGAPDWVKNIGGDKNEIAEGILLDPCGRPTVKMTIESVLDKIDDASLPAPQNAEAHAVLKLDPTGRLRWALGASPGANPDANGLTFWGYAIHPTTGQTRVVGDFRGSIDFGNGQNTTSTGGKNPFYFDIGP